jgi:hypothetical protein
VEFILYEFDAALVEDVAGHISPSISVSLTANVPPFCFPAAVRVHAFPKSLAPTEDLVGVMLWEVGNCFSQGSKNYLDQWVLDAEFIDQRVHHCNYCRVSCVYPTLVGWPVSLSGCSPLARLWDQWGGRGHPLLTSVDSPHDWVCVWLHLLFEGFVLCRLLLVYYVGGVGGGFHTLGKLFLIDGHWKQMSYRMSLSRDVGNLDVPSAKCCLMSFFPR